jgi:serine/threonine protein kinase
MLILANLILPSWSITKVEGYAVSFGASQRRRHEILEVVGSVGMGVVLKAFDEQLQRVVAIKALADSLASNEYARRRFVREGRAAAAIRDDHVIGIYGVDEINH